MSAEPLLERMNFRPYLPWLNWIITGCERAAKGKRSIMELDWVRDQGKRITPATMIIRSPLDLDKCTSEESLPDTSWFTEEMNHGSFQSCFAA